MKNESETSDGPLRALLHAARPAPPLPPRFQESVWRRVEQAKALRGSASLPEWLDRAATWLLRPRLALAGAVAMLLVGTSIGVVQGSNLAGELAKQRYLAAVSPDVTR